MASPQQPQTQQSPSNPFDGFDAYANVAAPPPPTPVAAFGNPQQYQHPNQQLTGAPNQWAQPGLPQPAQANRMAGPNLYAPNAMPTMPTGNMNANVGATAMVPSTAPSNPYSLNPFAPYPAPVTGTAPNADMMSNAIHYQQQQQIVPANSNTMASSWALSPFASPVVSQAMLENVSE